MKFKEAASIARTMKRTLAAFSRLEEMLSSAADAERAVQANEKLLNGLKSEIAECQSRIEVLGAEYGPRKSALDDEIKRLATERTSLQVENHRAHQTMNDEFARAKAVLEADHKAEVDALDAELSEKYKRLGEVDAKLDAAEEAFEALKQKLEG
jgi:chromosome segregation ATPase